MTARQLAGLVLSVALAFALLLALPADAAPLNPMPTPADALADLAHRALALLAIIGGLFAGVALFAGRL